ncbi:MAG: YciI family protein [Gemmatimonadales bacterium]
MRFMMLMLPRGYAAAAPGTLPDAAAVAAMARYNQELRRAGVLLSLDGLHPPATGARVSFAGGKPRVVDGPFPEAGEVVGGYWIIDVASKAEAVDWAGRCPAGEGNVIEVRQIQELTEFPRELQKAAGW